MKLTGTILWRWKNTIIDFSKYDDEWDELTKSNNYKMSYIMRKLPLPKNTEVHTWENGDYSSEYNWALEYAFDLNLVEVVHYIEELDIYLNEEQFQSYTWYLEKVGKKNGQLC